MYWFGDRFRFLWNIVNPLMLEVFNKVMKYKRNENNLFKISKVSKKDSYNPQRKNKYSWTQRRFKVDFIPGISQKKYPQLPAVSSGIDRYSPLNEWCTLQVPFIWNQLYQRSYVFSQRNSQAKILKIWR